MANEAVHQYLKDQNRPYSANDIVQNLHKKFGKTAIQKALDQLTQENKIIEKTYGKQKVYCIIQEDGIEIDKINQETAEMEEKIANIQETINTNNEKYKSLESQVKLYQESLTTDQARIEVANLETQVKRLRNKLKDLQENSLPISPEAKLKIETEHTRVMKLYKKRKQITMDVVNAILDGYPKSKKDLLEEAGVETDEDVGCFFGKQ